MTDPQTLAEWQAAVNAADFFLLVDSARQYGLIVYDGVIDAARCEELLNRGAERGVLPSHGATRRRIIARYVRVARARLGVTQRVLASAAGYTGPWLSGVEGGWRAIDDAAWQRLHRAVAELEQSHDRL